MAMEVIKIKVKVKFFATFRKDRGKVVDLEVDEGTVVKKILDFVKIPENHVAILLVNGRDGTIDQELKDGDTLSLFPPVGGG